MQINTIQSIESDELTISGNTLTINGTGYDLNAPVELPEGESPLTQRVYLAGNVETVITLKADVYRMAMFNKTKFKHDGREYYGSNLMRFYDVNDDGDISLDELAVIVDHWNMSEEDRRAAHKVVRDKYLENATVQDWLMKGVKKDPA